MKLHSVFVTGANRGIGLGLVKHLVQLPDPPKYVFATYRSEDGTEALKAIEKEYKKTEVILIKMDVTKKSDIEAARETVQDLSGDKGLTLLINNAGVAVMQPFPEITEENLLFHFKTNTIGPLLLVQELLPLLERSAAHRGSGQKLAVSRAAVISISAALGSVTLAEENAKTGLNVLSYGVSKAGLNMAMRFITADLKKRGILDVMICPGWVKTDMGTDMAALTLDESVTAILKTLEGLNENHHGSFTDRNGKPYVF